MQFFFGDRELLLKVQDLLAVTADVIVNPANSQLTHPGGLAKELYLKAGERIETESVQLIQEYGQIDSGMAVFTSAGQLPYLAVIHAVGPVLGEGDEQYKLEQVVTRSLQICEINEWSSVAFPAISCGHSKLPIEICAQAFFRSITHFWDARHECIVERIILCLTPGNFQTFFAAFREHGIEDVHEPVGDVVEYKEEPVAEINLSEDEIPQADGDIDDWFK